MQQSVVLNKFTAGLATHKMKEYNIDDATAKPSVYTSIAFSYAATQSGMPYL